MKKKQLEKLSIKEKKQFRKEEKDNEKKIFEFQEKLGLNNDKLRARKENKIENMINNCLKYNEKYKKLEKIPQTIIKKINKIIKKIIEYKLKKMHNFEKKLEKMKIELKPEEKEFFINYPLFCNCIGKKVDSFSNYFYHETKKLIEDIQKVKKNQLEIICPLKKKLEKKEKNIKNGEKTEKIEKKEIEKTEKKVR